MTIIPDNCLFYQTIELPGVGVVPGSWDHRDSTSVFLGHVDFNHKRVLDVGPANGFFSFEMERRGGEVTAIDLGQDSPWDVVPHPYLDEETLVANMRQNVAMVEKAFWFSHKILDSKVQLVYGTVYDVPRLVKDVDIALMSNVLQHFRDPLMAIQRVSKVVKETIVITETVWDDDPTFINNVSMRLIPRVDFPEVSHSWWQVSPGFVIESLKLLGFPRIRSETHLQRFNGASADSRGRMVKHFTVTARRALPLSPVESAKLQITFSPAFHEEESNDKHVWRWSPGPRSEIHIENLQSEDRVVGLSFGLSSITPNAKVQVLINERLAWKGESFYGTRPVFIGAVRLRPDRNIVTVMSTGAAVGPTTADHRILSFSIYDLKICEPDIS